MKKLEKILYNYLPKKDVRKILTSKRQFISLDLVDKPAHLYSSKVGGYGYLPKSIPYPTNKDNQPLSLLAQLNFDELPSLENFPETGILAFYIDYFDDLVGLDFDTPTKQENFRVIYVQDLTEESYNISEQKAVFEPYVEEELWEIVSEETKLKGQLSETISLLDTIEFEQFLGESYYDFLEERITDDEKRDEFEDLILSNGKIDETCIGGFPFFTQSDPREYDGKLQQEFNTLLFQLNSDDDIIMWGDTGVGNFFINDKKLKNKDFSNVLYNWDCY